MKCPPTHDRFPESSKEFPGIPGIFPGHCAAAHDENTFVHHFVHTIVHAVCTIVHTPLCTVHTGVHSVHTSVHTSVQRLFHCASRERISLGCRPWCAASTTPWDPRRNASDLVSCRSRIPVPPTAGGRQKGDEGAVCAAGIRVSRLCTPLCIAAKRLIFPGCTTLCTIVHSVVHNRAQRRAQSCTTSCTLGKTSVCDTVHDRAQCRAHDCGVSCTRL